MNTIHAEDAVNSILNLNHKGYSAKQIVEIMDTIATPYTGVSEKKVKVKKIKKDGKVKDKIINLADTTEGEFTVDDIATKVGCVKDYVTGIFKKKIAEGKLFRRRLPSKGSKFFYRNKE